MGYPVKDRGSASCRIRYYIFLENMPKEWEHKRYEHGKKCDLIYIQKKISDETINIIMNAKNRGIPVIYDRDDIRRRWKEEKYDIVMDNVSAVTTDTEIRANAIRKFTKTPVYVIPDCLDYGVTPEHKIEIRDTITKVVTYGRWKGTEAAAPFFARCPYPTRYFCDRKLNALKGSKYKEWKLEKFLSRLRKCDVAIIAHKDSWVMPMKSNNRILVAMSIGLPVLALTSPAYDETLKAAGHPELIIKNPKQTKKKLKYLESPEVRQKISDDLFDYAWKNYRPELSSGKLTELMRKVIDAKKTL